MDQTTSDAMPNNTIEARDDPTMRTPARGPLEAALTSAPNVTPMVSTAAHLMRPALSKALVLLLFYFIISNTLNTD